MGTSAKENILHKIRQALRNPVPLPFPDLDDSAEVFSLNNADAIAIFEEEFTKLQGKFLLCQDDDELKEQLKKLMAEKGWTKVFFKETQIASLFPGTASFSELALCDVAITGCECLIARTGTIVMSAARESGRTASVYAPIHICIANSSQVLDDLQDGLVFMKEKYPELPSQITFASGPSRTADIEKTLVTGVHGPKEVYCFLVNSGF